MFSIPAVCIIRYNKLDIFLSAEGIEKLWQLVVGEGDRFWNIIVSNWTLIDTNFKGHCHKDFAMLIGQFFAKILLENCEEDIKWNLVGTANHNILGDFFLQDRLDQFQEGIGYFFSSFNPFPSSATDRK